jgi:hypothetical protein
MTENTLSFTVYGKPRPEPRHQTGKGRAFSDGRADDWKGAVRLAALAARGIVGQMGPGGKRIGTRPIWVPAGCLPLFPTGPVQIGMEFRIPLPGRVTLKREGRRDFPDSKQEGDLDNLIKAVKDALGDWKHRGPIAWNDDGQAVRYRPEPVMLWATTQFPAGCRIILARARLDLLCDYCDERMPCMVHHGMDRV